MKIDVVFSGGGVKAFAFVGCLESIEQHRLTIERAAGTSAGAIVAALIAAGYTAQEVYELIGELQLKELLDPPQLTNYFPFMKWYNLYFKMGLNKGDKLELWIKEKLAKKDVYTFADIKSDYLKIIATDVNYARLVLIPDDLEDFYQIDPSNFPIATAVRMSAGFPYFFMPKKLSLADHETCLFIDGGLLSNFPLWVFNRRKKRLTRPVLGLKLLDQKQAMSKEVIHNGLNLLQAILKTIKTGHENRYLSIDQENIVLIPTGDISPINFDISQDTRERLIKKGEEATNQFLKDWP